MALRGLHLLPTDTRAAIRRRNGLADQFLDIAQQSGFVGIAQRDRDPIGSRPRRATDAVHIGFRDVW